VKLALRKELEEIADGDERGRRVRELIAAAESLGKSTLQFFPRLKSWECGRA
jgi:hypothetical protein